MVLDLFGNFGDFILTVMLRVTFSKFHFLVNKLK